MEGTVGVLEIVTVSLRRCSHSSQREGRATRGSGSSTRTTGSTSDRLIISLSTVEATKVSVRREFSEREGRATDMRRDYAVARKDARCNPGDSGLTPVKLG